MLPGHEASAASGDPDCRQRGDATVLEEERLQELKGFNHTTSRPRECLDDYWLTGLEVWGGEFRGCRGGFVNRREDFIPSAIGQVPCSMWLQRFQLVVQPKPDVCGGDLKR